MKIRITGKSLKKAQVGKDFPKISMPAPIFDPNNIPKEEAPEGYFDQKPLREFNESGIGPTFEMDEMDKRYQNDPQAQMEYDFSLYGYHQTNPNKDSKNYNKFMQNKYGIKDPANKPNFGALSALIGIGSNITDFVTDKKKQRDFDSYMREQQMSDNLFPSVSGSRGDYVNTGTTFGMFRPDQYVVNKGMYTAEQGGENPIPMNTIRIRIIDGPEQMAYGGQSGYGLDLGQRNTYSEMPQGMSESFSSTIGAVPRSAANIEAEGGETLYGDVDGDGVNEHMKISGPRHSNGGVPLNAPEGSFIFSDTKKMKIKDPQILSAFGVSFKKGGVTPASIAKKYDVNKYKAILEDPNADDYAKSTAQHMVKNYQDKLGRLAMIQEGMKDFPQGVPQVAQDMMQASQGLTEAAYGGYMPLPKAQKGKQTPSDVIFTPEFQQMLADLKAKQNVNMVYSPRIIAGDNNVPMMQGRQSSGLYGDITPAEMDEFKKRHQWYFKGRPNWNFKNKAEVEDFQRKYDDEYARKYGYSYFTEKRKFDKVDGKPGEYTYNAPGLEDEPQKPVTQPNGGYVCTDNGVKYVGPNDPLTGFEAYGYYATEAEARAVCKGKDPEPGPNPNKNTFTGNERSPFGYMTPDMVNMFAAAALPPKKYLPYMAPYKTMTADPTFYDPNRELAANAEQANIQSQYLSNFAGPQSFLANTAAVQGRAAENAANIMGRYNNLNVGVANDFSARQADTKNKEMVANVERSNELYKGNVIANEQYRNAKRQYLNNIAKTFGTAWNNRMNLGLMNATNPMYNIDNISGRSFFKKGYDVSKLGTMGSGAGGDWASIGADFMDARSKSGIADLSFDQYLKIKGYSTSSDKNGDGIPDQTTRRATAAKFGGYLTYPF